ncbi:unnamed protein product, partial [Protopolystoma xenopodis]
MAKLTDDSDYNADETSGNVHRPRSYSANDDAYNGIQTRLLVDHISNMYLPYSVWTSLSTSPDLAYSAALGRDSNPVCGGATGNPDTDDYVTLPQVRLVNRAVYRFLNLRMTTGSTLDCRALRLETDDRT